MKHSIVVLFGLFCGMASAQVAVPQAQVQGEVAALFQVLEQSQCEFGRNGSWYSAAAASAHLHRKYDYLVKHRLATTTELFIERAATRSSMSGQAYLVRCGGGKPVASQAWFMDALRHLRVRTAKSTGQR